MALDNENVPVVPILPVSEPTGQDTVDTDQAVVAGIPTQKRNGSLASLWTSLRRKFAAQNPPLGETKLAAIIRDHEYWIKCSGEQGKRADLSEQNLSNADLHEKNLTEANLRGAILRGAVLLRANVKMADLRDTDLTDADLSEIKGLLPEQISGANLTRAKLPEDILKFEGIKLVEELSKNAGKLFLTMISTAIFFGIILLKTTDVQILTKTVTTKIPLLDVDIPLNNLYWLGPLILVILYVAFHLYLQRLWEAIADLPAFFPDGMAVTRKTYPWLLNDMVRSGFPQLRKHKQPLAPSQAFLFTFLAYLLVPLSTVSSWLRFTMLHDSWVECIYVFFLGLFVCTFLIFFSLARATLARNDKHLNWWRDGINLTKLSMIVSLFVITSLAMFGFIFLSEMAYNAGCTYKPTADEDSGNLSNCTGWFLGYSPFAQLDGAELTERPDNWKTYEENVLMKKPLMSPSDESEWERMVAEITRQNYIRCNLNYASAADAFLIKANLYDASLKGINLERAHLQYAELDKAKLTSACLRKAFLYRADMRGAQLINADLSGAYLQGANFQPYEDNSDPGKGTDLTQPVFTDLSGANLSGANLSETNLCSTDLSGADLTNTILLGTNLKKAKGLTQKQLESAFTDRNIQLPRFVIP